MAKAHGWSLTEGTNDEHGVALAIEAILNPGPSVQVGAELADAAKVGW